MALLVVSGVYRHVRNPICVAVVAASFVVTWVIVNAIWHGVGSTPRGNPD